MKQWVNKLINQLNYDNDIETPENNSEISQDRATILFMLDTLNKHLLDINSRSVRKVRTALDDYSKELLFTDPKKNDRTLFRLREFFGRYRVDEYTYILKTFNDFKSIIWDFVEQISDDIEDEIPDDDLQHHIDDLRDAVEANSMESLREKSLSFIDSYSEHQVLKDRQKSKKLKVVKKNLESVKQQLVEAHHSLKRDHLTGAFNRMSFDQQMQQHWQLGRITKTPLTLFSLDIDHFKMVNDTHGHAIGDFVLVETVKLLQQIFNRDKDFVARVGGEEFAVILPDYDINSATKKAQYALEKVRESVFVQDDSEIRFTISIGIAEFNANDTVEAWMKRADDALYVSKNRGRNRYTVAEQVPVKKSA